MRTVSLLFAATALLPTASAQVNEAKFVSKGSFDGQQLELRVHPSRLRYALGEPVYLTVDVVNPLRLLHPKCDRDWPRFCESR